MSSATEAQYTYDSRGFLESVTLGSDTIAYVLDGQGRRVAREENGVVKDRFLYKDFINPVAWQDAGDSVAYFVYGGRGHVPDWMVKGGAYYRLVTDHLGSVRRVVNVETGVVVQEMNYDEWGNVIADSSPGFQPFGYAGGLYDGATGLVHFGFREYSPQTGRWMTKDPIGFDGGWNWYEYVASYPIGSIDVSGLRFTYPGPVEDVRAGVLIADMPRGELPNAINDTLRYVTRVGGTRSYTATSGFYSNADFVNGRRNMLDSIQGDIQGGITSGTEKFWVDYTRSPEYYAFGNSRVIANWSLVTGPDGRAYIDINYSMTDEFTDPFDIGEALRDHGPTWSAEDHAIINALQDHFGKPFDMRLDGSEKLVK